MLFGLCNAPATFQRCMTTIFHDMVEDFIEVFMDDFSVYEYSEEEVAETMAETMEQYMSKTQADYGSGVARPKIKDKDNFELKGESDKFKPRFEEPEVAPIGRSGRMVLRVSESISGSRLYILFNYLLGIDTDLLTKDEPRFKTYKEFKDDWIKKETMEYRGLRRHEDWTCVEMSKWPIVEARVELNDSLNKQKYVSLLGVHTLRHEEFEWEVGDLAVIDTAISDEDQALLLLTSLPSSYDNFMETLLYGWDTLKLEV
ncbi:hypothetical protein Tco_1238954, partial [Tanacetum coccineum]